jgi:hypothetical protein
MEFKYLLQMVFIVVALVPQMSNMELMGSLSFMLNKNYLN